MKRVVVDTGLLEADIRPPELFSEFKRLSLIDAATHFADTSALVEVPCPGCGGEDRCGGFRSNGFLFNTCGDCGSLYVSPRPTAAALDDYYARSRASRYRIDHFTRETARARRVHLLRSNAYWIARLVGDRDGELLHVDVETHAPQIFAELDGQGLFGRLVSLRPLAGLEDEIRRFGGEVTAEPPAAADAITALEKLENRASPMEFVQRTAGMLGPGGVLFLTSRTCSGFDQQVLGPRSPFIFVPEHLNLLSIEGITALIDRCGLELIELSTPGQLDLELTRHAAEHDPAIELPPFLRYLLDHRDTEAHRDFQAFLQKHRLSSHVRAAAMTRRRGTTT